MHGLTNSVKVQGLGWVEWTMRDYFGQVALIRTRAYYIPQAHIRLLSPQTYFGFQERGHGWFDHKKFILTTADGIDLTFPYSCGGNLPLMFLDNKVHMAGLTGHMLLQLNQAHCASKITQLLDDQNHNLTRPQKELCLWHYRLAHAGFPWIQTLMRVEKVAVGEIGTPPIIPTKMPTASRVDAPKCPSCLLGKQHRLNPGSQTTVNKPEREMAIRRKAEKPGDQAYYP